MTEELLEQLRRLDYLLRRYYGYGHHGNSSPHRGQGRILSVLKLKPEISQKELTYLLDLRKQSLAELLTKLEQKGYIVREPSEKDRRVLNVHLTKAGSDAVDQLEMKVREQKDIFAVLKSEEKAQFTDYLHRLIDELEAEIGSDSEQRHRQHHHSL